MAGRKPLGPQLVHHLDGSERAKERLETMLETVAGKCTISDACKRLGISEAMFFRLRTLVLQEALSRLEPRPPGRPSQNYSQEQKRIAELESLLREKDAELKAVEVRLDISQAMPLLLKEEAPKKTTKQKPRRKPAAKRQRRRRK